MATDGIKRSAPDLYAQEKLTPVKVKNKDTGETFTINMVNADIVGNKVKYEVKDGKVLKDGKPIKDNEIELLRYQTEAIKAAAEGDGFGDKHILDSNDINGTTYAENLEKRLQNAKSEFHVYEYPDQFPAHKTADATESGLFTALLQNNKGEKGRIDIIFKNR